MTERLQEILNRKPSKWGNLTVKEFERDIKLLQERVQELESELNKQIEIGYKFEGEANDLAKENKRYREAIIEALHGLKTLPSVAPRLYLISILDKALGREG